MLGAVIILSAGLGLVLEKVTQAKPASASADHVVNLRTDHADPSAIAVTKGTYVQFNTKDNLTHNIGEGSGDDETHQQLHEDTHDHTYKGKESGNFGAGSGYRVQFNKTGTYTFHDHLHPKISITVVVY